MLNRGGCRSPGLGAKRSIVFSQDLARGERRKALFGRGGSVERLGKEAVAPPLRFDSKSLAGADQYGAGGICRVWASVIQAARGSRCSWQSNTKALESETPRLPCAADRRQSPDRVPQHQKIPNPRDTTLTTRELPSEQMGHFLRSSR